jgi:tetratricopeptide (TPR) repeat protein
LVRPTPPPPDAPASAPVLALPSLPLLPAAAPDAFPEEDQARVRSLEALVRGSAPGGPSDVSQAEALLARYPGDPNLTRLAASALIKVGVTEGQARRFPEAATRFRRAAELLPGEVVPWLSLAHLLLDAGDWPAAEGAARQVLILDPRSIEGHEALAFALYRQDRNREAIETLRIALSIRETPSALGLLARIEKGLQDERGMTEQRIAHFHVRYDGEAHDDVGREILRALERHYLTLVTALDHQPAGAIPVVLFSREQYYDASGAPAWSGGNYDLLDGRIRIPIGGLTSALSPHMDGTLIHELTHAFIADMSRGVAPREIHEGLAQYMEGKRSAALLGDAGLRALADGHVVGIQGYYLEALALIEYLMAQRGQGGINELLKAMGSSGSADGGCRGVFGKGWNELQQAFRSRLRQQYGG